MINLALVYKQLGDFEKALGFLQQVKKINPREVASYNNKANILYLQEKFEEAAISYLRGLEIQPNDEDTLCNLGLVLSRINFHDYAKIAFEEGINLNPGNKVLLSNYLLFLLEIKQFDKFNTILNHARRVMDQPEIAQFQKLLQEFQKALNTTSNANQPLPEQSKPNGALKSALKQFFRKRESNSKIVMKNTNPSIAEVVEEEQKDEYWFPFKNTV